MLTIISIRFTTANGFALHLSQFNRLILFIFNLATDHFQNINDQILFLVLASFSIPIEGLSVFVQVINDRKNLSNLVVNSNEYSSALRIRIAEKLILFEYE